MLPQSLVDLLPLPLPLSASAGIDVVTLPTGVEALDAGLAGGGLPRGRLTEVVGARGSGKATLLRQIVERTLSQGWVAYVDATRTLAPRDWAHLGDGEGLWMIRPRDPSGAAWRAARRGDLGATGVQLLLPFRATEKSSLTTREAPGFSPASAGAPSPSSASAISTLLPPSEHLPDARPLPGHWDDSPIVLTELAGPKTTAGRRRLRAVSAAAGRAGIRAGMTIAEARGICAELHEYPWDDVALAGATAEMTALLLEGR